ncbi:hypothetical protein [uncultured Alistipes sp.]|uniref:hypothetical protein n=1 Tax=uncultured Alistipes sp. TaxID=538949 RepID=UPI00272D8240|nr:hypothetical protein [uncultured Alistipes sp.]
MKTYVITLSKRFPTGHNRAGDLTFFHEALSNALHNTEATLTVDDADDTSIKIYERKIHTIRANYPLWAKRIAEVERGEACLSIRQWTGKPYRSKQVEIARMTKEDGIGIQRLEFVSGKLGLPRIGIVYQRKNEIALNDGLSFDDWESWFKNYDLTQPMAIIHFTQFRY